MSRQINNRDNIEDAANKRLKEFLERNSETTDDVFDKEAKEGFGTLESPFDAMELKAALDEKIKSTFLQNKKSREKYWLAAASLMLVVGLSVYFINNSTYDQKNLAVSEKVMSTEPLSLNSTKNKEFIEKANAPQNPIKTAAGRMPDSKKNSEPAKTKHENNFSGQYSEPIASAKANGSGNASEILVAPAVNSENDDVQSGKGDNAERNKKDIAVTSKNFEPEEEQQAKSTLNRFTSKSANAMAPANSSPNNLASGDLDLKEKAASNVYYNGGETALAQTLKQKLLKIDCNGKFEALLFINNSGKVEKAELSKTYDLNDKQQKQVIEILYSLENFKFYSAPANKAINRYKVVYPK